MIKKEGPQVRHVPFHELPEFPYPLSFECGACGHTDSYHPGKVTFNPACLLVTLGASAEEGFFFTAYFHCRHCGAGGPWHLPPQTLDLLLASIPLDKESGRDACISVGTATLFDGTSHRFATDAEAHLRSLIAQDPGNAFLYTRLGNILRNGRRPDLAIEPYRRAIEIDPGDLEAQHSLGEAHDDLGKGEEAVPYFHEVLRRAREAKGIDRRLVRKLVEVSLRRLVDLRERLGDKISLIPEPDAHTLANAKESGEFEIRRYDLSTKKGLGQVCDMFMGVPGRGELLAKVMATGAGSAPRRSFQPRNAPCPCGSGSKYKNCCGRGESR